MPKTGMNRPKPILIEMRERRSLALHRAVVRRLRENPELWAIPLQNLDRWDSQSDSGPRPGSGFWREILATKSHDEIIKMILSKSERGVSWRKNSPFVGIISQDERHKIYDKYKPKV